MSESNPELTLVKRWWAMSYRELAEEIAVLDDGPKAQRGLRVLQARLALEQSKTARSTKALVWVAAVALVFSALSTGVAGWATWENRSANRETVKLMQNDQCREDAIADSEALSAFVGRPSAEAQAELLNQFVECRKAAGLPADPGAPR